VFLAAAVRDALTGINDDRIALIISDRLGLSEDLVDGKPRTLNELAKQEGVSSQLMLVFVMTSAKDCQQ
jgi:DNA-directed RNA polymerase sigma subunit (sigma70/sigma32)